VNSARHVPPADDEPLDAVELALVRALAAIIVRNIREEAVAAKAKNQHPRSEAS
jgi:hypothetical protein